MSKRYSRIVAVCFLFGMFTNTVSTQTASAQTAVSADEAIHNELRAVQRRLIEAVNKKDVDALFAEVSPNIEFTAMNNDHVKGIGPGRAYFSRMLTSSEKFLNNMSMTSEADALAELYAEKQMAIATGIAKTHFDIRGGLAFDVPLRWTATMERTSGNWKLAAVHFSADAGDNPLLTAATAFWKWMGLAFAGLGIVGGFLAARLWRRQG